MDTQVSEAQAIIDFAKSRTEPMVLTIKTHDDQVPDFPAFVDARGELKSVAPLVDAQRVRPRRRTGTVNVTTVESFIELTVRDSNPNSMIFANDSTRPSLTAVLNFHAPGSAEGAPEFCDDKVAYAFPLSDEWKAWVGANGAGNKMDQAAFAEFIEDRLFDIGDPGAIGNTTEAWAAKMGVKLAGPSALMAVSRGLSIKVEETFKNVVKRETGETDFVFATQHKDAAGEEVRVPAAFHVLIPILRNGPAYSIPVRLRYRTGGGKIAWFFEMHRPEVFLLDAVKDAIAKVRASRAEGGCELPVIMGIAP